ncbi:MAG: NAD(P)-binding domain-containing protein [Bacillota bacterium]
MINYEAVIIGDGQAGLAIGYFLKKEKLSFVIIEKNGNVGDSWRQRYNSLVLFTPRQYSSLPGLQMRGPSEEFRKYYLVYWFCSFMRMDSYRGCGLC